MYCLQLHATPNKHGAGAIDVDARVDISFRHSKTRLTNRSAVMTAASEHHSIKQSLAFEII